MPISTPEAGPEPLPRWLQLQSQRAPARRQPIGGGAMSSMPNIAAPGMGIPMSAMDSQQFMDDQQGGMLMDSPSSPFGFASQRTDGEPRRTVATPVQQPASVQGNCRPGTACYAKQQSALARQLGLPEGSIISHIDGSPIGGGQYQIPTQAAPRPAAAPARPAAPSVAQRPAASKPQPAASTPIADRYQQDMMGMVEQGRQTLDDSSSRFQGGDIIGSANSAVPGRAATAAGYAGLQAVPGIALQERELGLRELNDAQTREVTDFNIKASAEKTVAGNNQQIDQVLRGVNEYYGQTPVQRAKTAAIAAHMAIASFPESPATQQFNFEKTLSEYTGQALAYDLARAITDQGEMVETPVDGKTQTKFTYNTGRLSNIDDAVQLRYFQMTDPVTKQRLTGDALRMTISSEMMPILQREIGAFITEKYPTMPPRDVRNLAMESAGPVVEELYGYVNGLNTAGNGGMSFSQAWTMIQSQANEMMKQTARPANAQENMVQPIYGSGTSAPAK